MLSKPSSGDIIGICVPGEYLPCFSGVVSVIYSISGAVVNPKNTNKVKYTKAIFKNSILIGRRFKLVHVRFGREVIEVATFRAAAKKESDNHLFGKRGLLIRDNIFGITNIGSYWYSSIKH